jgi:ComF family protein
MSLQRIFSFKREIFLKTLDFFLPPQCLCCSSYVAVQGGLCSQCWPKFDFITVPYCEKCGLPFEVRVSEITQCLACLQNPPSYEQARSVLFYNEFSKGLILRFKHGDATYLAPYFVTWLGRIYRESQKQVDYLVPVPLHWLRFLKRQYNQAGLLAQGLSKKIQVPLLPQLLKRTRATQSQGSMSAERRYRNIKGAFSLNGSLKNKIEGKHLLLVDDVLTSGATVSECTRVLMDQGKAASVSVLTLARVSLKDSY